MKHVWGRGRARVLGLALLACTALAAGSAAFAARDSGARSTPKPNVAVQILAINDFHGNLEPPTGSSGRITMSTGVIDGVGGAAYLATHLALLRGANPANTFVVSAGDVIGASPLLSAGFHDEPSIEAFNQLGVDLNAVGNHEFDEGPDELLRMQNGGCHPVDGCQAGHTFEGADFPFLSANVIRKSTGKTLFAPLRDQELRGRPGRLHRPGHPGHAEHRDRLGRRRRPVPGRGRHCQPLRQEAQEAAASRRSSSSCTRAWCTTASPTPATRHPAGRTRST